MQLRHATIVAIAGMKANATKGCRSLNLRILAAERMSMGRLNEDDRALESLLTFPMYCDYVPEVSYPATHVYCGAGLTDKEA